jgi:hypothetical protein
MALRPLVIADISGGLNSEDSAHSLPDNQVVLCENMDLGRGSLGGRRRGHQVVTSGPLTSGVFLHRHLPTNDESESELWLVSVSGTTSKWQKKDTAWANVSVTGTEALDVAEGAHRIRGQSLHGKLFLAYPTVSGTDRLHVWDGTSVRLAGMAEPGPPTTADQGAGSLTGLRYYRTRETRQVSSVTVLRSEPSTSDDITPSGGGQYVRVTKAATANTSATHWEVEASTDNVLFYRIATVAIGTTTYDDDSTTTEITADETLLSEDIGDYALIHNPKFLSADQDRLLVAGSWEQTALASRIGWTPVFGASGVGNDERFEDGTDPFLDLDGFDGGELTDFAGPLFGFHVAYKRKRIYKIIRTFARNQAYQAVPMTDAFGAITGSVVKGLDEAGRACQYFIDPDVGPCRVGANGIERCGSQIHATIQRVDCSAAVAAHGVFYHDLMQVWWDVAETGSDTPTFRIKLEIEAQTPGRQGAIGGWSTDTGPYMATLCSAMYSGNVNAGVARCLNLKPVFGTAISGATVTMGDTGTTDNGTEYRAYARTKPYFPAGLLGSFPVRTGTLLADASEAQVSVSLVRDYGKETRDMTVSLAPSPEGESAVIVPLENVEMAELRAVQIEYGDPAPADADWVIQAIALQPESGQMQ